MTSASSSFLRTILEANSRVGSEILETLSDAPSLLARAADTSPSRVTSPSRHGQQCHSLRDKLATPLSSARRLPTWSPTQLMFARTTALHQVTHYGRRWRNGFSFLDIFRLRVAWFTLHELVFLRNHRARDFMTFLARHCALATEARPAHAGHRCLLFTGPAVPQRSLVQSDESDFSRGPSSSPGAPPLPRPLPHLTRRRFPSRGPSCPPSLLQPALRH